VIKNSIKKADNYNIKKDLYVTIIFVLKYSGEVGYEK